MVFGVVPQRHPDDASRYEWSASKRAQHHPQPRPLKEKALRSAGSELSEPYTIDWSKARRR